MASIDALVNGSKIWVAVTVGDQAVKFKIDCNSSLLAPGEVLETFIDTLELISMPSIVNIFAKRSDPDNSNVSSIVINIDSDDGFGILALALVIARIAGILT